MPAGTAAPRMPTVPHRLADDVVRLLDALEFDRAVLAGVSMGGGTAVDTALEHPDRVAGLVVSGTGTSEPQFSDPWTLSTLAEWNAAQERGDLEGWIDAFMRLGAGPGRTADDIAPGVWQLVETMRSEEHTSELQSRGQLVCRLLLEKKKKISLFM